MASLTESYLSYNSSEQPKPNNKWFDSIYLCIEKSVDSKNMACYKFDSYEKAEKYYEAKKEKNNIFKDLEYSIIPICKWVPLITHKPIIKYKLNKNYSMKDITIFQSIHK